MPSSHPSGVVISHLLLHLPHWKLPGGIYGPALREPRSGTVVPGRPIHALSLMLHKPVVTSPSAGKVTITLPVTVLGRWMVLGITAGDKASTFHLPGAGVSHCHCVLGPREMKQQTPALGCTPGPPGASGCPAREPSTSGLGQLFPGPAEEAWRQAPEGAFDK